MDKNVLVNQYYEEFKVFIKENNMPLVIPVEKSSNKNMGVLAFIERDYIRERAIPIVYNKTLFDYNENFIKSIFFHEFTHIYDANIKFKNLNENDFNTIMDTFSEYHASQIEMGSILGMKNKNDVLTISSKVKSKRKIFYKNELEYIESYVVIPLSDITSVICQDKGTYINMPSFEFTKQYMKIEKNIFYYYGKYDLYIKYSGRNMQDLLISNCPEFSKEINNIHKILKSKDIVNNIDSMRSAVHNFKEKYFEYFS